VKLDELIKIFGEYKNVIDQKTGIAYKVPSRDIITRIKTKRAGIVSYLK